MSVFQKVALFVFTLLIMLSPSSYGRKTQPNKSSKSFLKISAGSFFSNKRIYRGALIYDVPFIFFGPRFTLFKSLTVAGPRLIYTKKLNKNHSLSFSLSYFDDQPANGPLVLLGSREQADFKNQRYGTWDSSVQYNYRLKRLFSLSVSLYQDLKQHWGNYISLKLETGVLKYVNLGLEVGTGDSKSNKYAYGASATSGVAHINYSISSFLPILPWKGKLIPSYIISNIQQSENKNAEYIKGIEVNHKISLVMTWNIL